MTSIYPLDPARQPGLQPEALAAIDAQTTEVTR